MTKENENTQKNETPPLLIASVSDRSFSKTLKDKLEYHLNKSVRAWHGWNSQMPMSVEVICNQISERYGRFLTVKQWLIIPSESGLKECLVAEFDIMVNYLGKEEPLHLHVNHLCPSQHVSTYR